MCGYLVSFGCFVSFCWFVCLNCLVFVFGMFLFIYLLNFLFVNVIAVEQPKICKLRLQTKSEITKSRNMFRMQLAKQTGAKERGPSCA